MATMNFSIPEDLKEEFQTAFADENRSALIARFMREAIEERRRQARRAEAIEALIAFRDRMRPASDREIAKARRAGRP